MSTTTSLVTGVDFVSLPDQQPGLRRWTSTATCSACRALERLAAARRRAGRAPSSRPAPSPSPLIPSERLGITFQPNLVPLALQVEDVAAARTELESRGVTFFAETIDSGVCHMAHFADPDGNVADAPPPLRAAVELGGTAARRTTTPLGGEVGVRRRS